MGKTDVAIPKRKSLAGKCGIPFEKNREYGEPVFERRENPIPIALEFPNGRRLRMGSAVGYDEYGREIFGNLCRHWTMRPNDAGTESSDLWEGFGRWFVRKEAAARKSPIRAMEQCR